MATIKGFQIDGQAAKYQDLNVANEFNTETTYQIGDYVLNPNDGVLYKFIQNHSIGNWNSEEVVAVNTADEIKNKINISSIDKTLQLANSPADAKSVGDLIFSITGNKPIQFSDKTLRQYIEIPNIGEKVSWNNPTIANSNEYKWAVIECKKDDVFTISGTGGISPRLWAFLDSSKRVLEVADKNKTENSLIKIAPENSAYLVINDKTDKISYYGRQTKTGIDNLVEMVDKLIDQMDNTFTLASKEKIAIPENQDLNDYKTSGNFKVVNTTRAKTLLNMPKNITSSGSLYVLSSSETRYIFQIYIAQDDNGRIFIRRGLTSNNTFSDWTEILTDTHSGYPIESIINYDKSKKEYLFDHSPFYKIIPIFEGTDKPYYYNEGKSWIQSGSNYYQAIIKCPKYFLIRWLNKADVFVYVGTLTSNKFIVDESIKLAQGTDNVLNKFGKTNGFHTYESDGTKYLKILVGSSAAMNLNSYVEFIGADEWPDTPVHCDAWYYQDAKTNRKKSKIQDTKCSYFLPEESWIFIKNLTKDYYISYGMDTTTRWASQIKNPSAFYVPKGSGATLLTINAEDVDNMTDSNVYLMPKLIDKCLTSNSLRACNLAHKVLTQFKYVGKNNTVNIAGGSKTDITKGTKIVIGKKYCTIPYSSRWNVQHFVCFDTTPETAANAANDEYSIFYDTDLDRNELGQEFKPGYGGVCSTFLDLALGCPYPQTTSGYFVDENFIVEMLDNPRSGDGALIKNATNAHALLIADVFENGYSVYEERPPGFVKNFHTCDSTLIAKNNVLKSSLNNYNYRIQSKDRSGWQTNYLNFDYTIANGSIRPWRGNKSVCSNYNRLAPSDTKLIKHTGIYITVHDNASIAYMVKPSGTIVSIDVAGQTIVNVEEYLTESGTYELYSDVSDVREYFRYFDHEPVTLYLDQDGTAIFSSDEVDYAFVWCNHGGTYSGFPEVGTAAPSIIARGKKYPGITITHVKGAMIRDRTLAQDGITEDSWGRYPVMCTLIPPVDDPDAPDKEEDITDEDPTDDTTDETDDPNSD